MLVNKGRTSIIYPFLLLLTWLKQKAAGFVLIRGNNKYNKIDVLWNNRELNALLPRRNKHITEVSAHWQIIQIYLTSSVLKTRWRL